MTKPLALLVYEHLLPGSQLINRLQDLGYRVQTLSDLAALVDQARQEKPMVAFVDLNFRNADACAVIHALRAHPDTAHVPVIAFCDPKKRPLQKAAHEAGATLVAASDGILDQLATLIDRAIDVQ
jgi:PleD family two-component response regulator